MQEGPEAQAETIQADTGEETEIAGQRLAPDPEEADWIRRAQAGEVAAFDWLMTRYRDRAVRLAAHILRRPIEAEDLVQEAFLRAFWQIRGFRGDCAFFTWLYRIVLRLCLNRKREPWWRREQAAQEEEALFESAEPMPPEDFETRLLIENLLDRLTPPMRAVLVLRELEGLDYAEIAALLEIPVGTVRSRLNAARAQFRLLWQRVMEESSHV
jgi:RNA polymerase sigma-70 factor (ECF subfamily)